MTPMEGTDTILALFRTGILGQHPAAPCSPGPFGLLLRGLCLSSVIFPVLSGTNKGVLAKGVSAEASVAPKETENNQGYWAQQCIWHSERHSQERRTYFCKNPPSLGS